MVLWKQQQQHGREAAFTVVMNAVVVMGDTMKIQISRPNNPISPLLALILISFSIET